MPAVNLSNRLNPNNIHYDRVLAAQYKRMSKPEKEALWAQDRLMQQRAAQSQVGEELRQSVPSAPYNVPESTQQCAAQCQLPVAAQPNVPHHLKHCVSITCPCPVRPVT